MGENVVNGVRSNEVRLYYTIASIVLQKALVGLFIECVTLSLLMQLVSRQSVLFFSTSESPPTFQVEDMAPPQKIIHSFREETLLHVDKLLRIPSKMYNYH